MTFDTVAELPGYTRGLAIHGPLAFIGLSKIRETSTFGGVPIADRRETLTCGVAVVELATGRQIALLDELRSAAAHHHFGVLGLMIVGGHWEGPENGAHAGGL